MSLAESLSGMLPRLNAKWRDGALDDATYAAGYFLSWQIALHGPRCASRKSKSKARPDSGAWLSELEIGSGERLRQALLEWLESYQFLGVIPNVTAALSEWLRGGWPLHLLLRVPSPEEVLRLQARGTRPVTVVADHRRALQPLRAKPDAFAFLIHDLEHAHKFFHPPRLHEAQRRFFRLLLAASEAGLFDVYRGDPGFADRFAYLISDMNTHPVHGFRYLGAVLIECLLRREGRGPKDALSPRGEAELTGLLTELGRLGRFPDEALIALRRLPSGRFGTAEAAALERTLLEQAEPESYA